ncbi:hypothetical protein ACSVDM_21460 [Nocardia sp. JW2]|uniref:hypothetical protein n=1 Tax=Nocardia sp. JW2 TaxID=3450738 RepID=UPI003F4290EB
MGVVLGRRGAHYQPDQDVSEWISFNLLAYHQQAQTVHARFERSARVWEQSSKFATGSGLDDRIASALHDVAMAGRVRRSRYGASEGLSVQQAQRDLKTLTQREILEPVGRTRARYYVAGERFPENILSTARTPMGLVDPYRL